MTRESKLIKRLVALFLLGCVLLNYPILSLFNPEITVFGLPLLYIYIFGIWCLLIGLTALATFFRSNELSDNSDSAGGR
ncbi:MAG: hypothetical protein HKO68_07015 [Desulfobacterales bacterium]|nr:hypothetical protein [Deltaproteobacteria bacterium]NNL76069.1 hypothetical protein [Desulfobacterales bacterium]